MPPARHRQIDDPPWRQGQPRARAVQGTHLGEDVGAAVGAPPERAEREGAGHVVGDGPGEDRVGGDLDEGGVAVGRGRGEGPVQPYRPPQVRRPVSGVEDTVAARVVQDGGVDGHTRCSASDVGQGLGQLGQQRLDLGRVSGADDPHGPGRPPLFRQPSHEPRHRRFLTGDDLLSGRGVDGDMHTGEVVGQGVEFTVGEVDDGHRPAPQPAEQPGPFGDDPGALRHVQGARAHRGGHLAQGVADDGGGFDTVGTPHLGERHLESEQDGLGHLQPVQLAPGREPVVQGQSALRVDLLHGGGEGGLLGQQPAAHPGPLAAVPGEDPHRAAPHQIPLTGDDPAVRAPLRQRVQPVREFVPVPGDHGRADASAARPPGQGAGHVGGVRGRCPEPVGEPGRGVPQPLLVHVGQEMQPGAGFLGRTRAQDTGPPFLQYGMGVGAAEPEP